MAETRLVKKLPEMPERLATINYTGGSVTAARGVLAAMFQAGEFPEGCESVLRDRSRNSYTRSAYIGAPSVVVGASNWQEVKYNSQTKSLAAGGEPIQLRIKGEWWGARLSGNHSNFMTWLCGQTTMALSMALLLGVVHAALLTAQLAKYPVRTPENGTYTEMGNRR